MVEARQCRCTEATRGPVQLQINADGSLIGDTPRIPHFDIRIQKPTADARILHSVTNIQRRQPPLFSVSTPCSRLDSRAGWLAKSDAVNLGLVGTYVVGDLAGKSVDANLLLGSEQVFFSIDQVSSYPATWFIFS